MQIVTARFLQVAFGSIAMIVGIETLKPAIATAPMSFKLYPAVLNGGPVKVVYMTNSGDKLLIRCYPGQQPNLLVVSMPGGSKEGRVVCR